MYAHFRYLDGPRQGTTQAIGHDFATIGRHPASDLPFDATDELQVSVRHAAVFKQGNGFVVRDLGSTNGTYLNGKRVRGDRPLAANDVLRFGPTGPTVEFTIATTPPPATPSRSRLPPPGPASADIIRPAGRTTERIRAEVTRQSRPWKWLAISTVVVALGAAGLFGAQAYQVRQDLEQERTVLLARVNTLRARLEQAAPPIAGLQAELKAARSGVDSLRLLIASGRISPARLDTLAHALGSQTGRHEVLLSAATLDPVSASRTSSNAVAVVVADFGAGQVRSGTGFAIRRSADTVWVATARHVVQDSLGRSAGQLAVIFNGTGQAFKARIGLTHDSADVALVTVSIRGGAPVVAGLSDSVQVGDPVAITGFPFGLDSLGDWRTTGTAATSATGTVTDRGPDFLGLDGYGTHGSSGSPVFAKNGIVVGLVSGGDPGAARRLIAVPARFIRALRDSALGTRRSALGARRSALGGRL